MFRVTGLVALLAASLLTTILFMRVYSVRVEGKLGYGSGLGPRNLLLRMDTATTNKPDPEKPAYLSSGDVYRLGDDLDPELPEKADVTVILRWIHLPQETFECVEVEYGGKSYACGRSRQRFFLWLALLGSAPLLLWAFVAIPAQFFRAKSR